jgi:protein ImuA
LFFMAAPAFHHPPLSAESLIAQMPHALWRADQMACGQSVVTASGHAGLDSELPNGGWPASSLTELLLQQAGIGELQLLQPALAAIARTRPVVLIHPPHLPQVAAWCGWGLPHEHLLWLKTGCSADALWSAEQVLRNGSCGALLIWQTQIRPEALRRLHLAAQAAQTLLWMMRPLAQAHDPSPAPLRLGLRPAAAGIEITLVKRRGPQRDVPLFLPLAGMPAAIHVAPVNHALVDRLAPAAVAAGMLSAALV